MQRLCTQSILYLSIFFFLEGLPSSLGGLLVRLGFRLPPGEAKVLLLSSMSSFSSFAPAATAPCSPYVLIY
ncbi:hypothetical protein EDD21DRAFT_392598 [Dissophora ornata]|nr:hypothetical protein EDD21DRAFT_392598 [Dissophora ornata]